MTKKLIIILVLLIVSASFLVAQTDHPIEKSSIIENINGKDYYLHFVEKGETLFAIAAAYDIRVDVIFKENPQSRKGIHAGVVLKIPVKQDIKKVEEEQHQAETQSPSFFYHIVQNKETYYGIAKKYNIGVEQLIAMNPEAGSVLNEGQSLKVPALNKEQVESNLAPEAKIVHMVEEGETLYSIARKYQLTLGQIYNLNPKLSESLSIGDQIFIPEPQKAETIPLVLEEENQQHPQRNHHVKQGETLYSIARDYAVSLDSIFYYNPGLLRETPLSIGKVIKLPPLKNTKHFIVHKSAKRQSLDKISEMYQVEYEEIVKLNPDIARKARKGQSVKIPVDPLDEEEETELIEDVSDTPESIPCDEAYHPDEKTFNVALMLPLFLEELDSLPRQENFNLSSLDSFKSFKSLRFLNFYAGFKMALDSMEHQGMKVNLFVYDVDNTEEKTNQVLHASELSGMDIIIGPLFGKSFSDVANFAKTYEIPIVNPLSQREEIILDNPWVYKIKPTEEFQNEQLIDYILKNHPNDNVIIVRNNKYKYQSEVSFIRNSINRSRPGHQYLSNADILDYFKKQEKNSQTLLTENKLFKRSHLKQNIHDSSFVSNMVNEVIYVNDSAKGLALNLSVLRPNIVIAISDDIVFSKDLVSKLNKLGRDRDITLFGTPNWMSFTDMESNHLLSLNFHCFSPSIVNYGDKRVRQWIEQYRDRYRTEPASYNFAFDGFDVGWYFLNALYRFGSEFYSCTNLYNPGLIQNGFNFQQKPMSGYQNTHWNIGHYENYRLVRVEDNFNFDQNKTGINW